MVAFPGKFVFAHLFFLFALGSVSARIAKILCRGRIQVNVNTFCLACQPTSGFQIEEG